MNNPLILLHYMILREYHDAHGHARISRMLYETLDELRSAVAKRCAKLKCTLDDFYVRDDVYIFRCYGRYDSAKNRVVRLYDKVSLKSLISDGV